jgi:surface polysaccharide O-acyltransferase-like enzyme
MVAVWFVFAVMIYVIEPLLVHRVFHEYALRNKERAFAIAIRLHAIRAFPGGIESGGFPSAFA